MSSPRAIRFLKAQVDVADERCTAVVALERAGVGVFTGTAQGGSGEADQLRAVARAAADAVSDVFKSEGAQVRVRGVQSVDAFAQTVVIVSLAASRGTRNQPLLGVSDGSADLTRATALAVLNATNRFLGGE